MVIFAIFYVGRVLGYIVSKAANLVLWKQYRVTVSIQSLVFSPLAGKVHFKNVSVTSQDQLISVLKGTITWRYWLIGRYRRSGTADGARRCRFALKFEGFEYFVYNRNGVYDRIARELDGEDTSAEPTVSVPSVEEVIAELQDDPLIRRFLPVEFLHNKGAIVLGNKQTHSVAIMNYEKLAGTVSIEVPDDTRAPSSFRTEAKISNCTVAIKPNISYEVDNPVKIYVEPKRTARLWKKYKTLLGTVLEATLHAKRKKEQHQTPKWYDNWRGLSMYDVNLDEELDEEVKFDIEHHEYAKCTTVLKADQMDVTYSYGMPGTARVTDSDNAENPLLERPELDHSVDILVYDANCTYGPWANRQVQQCLRVFSPTVCRNFKLRTPEEIAQQTEPAAFKLSVTIMEDSVLRVPMKESSKDAAFLEKYKQTRDETRPFGWIDIRIAKESNITVRMAAYPTENGFENILHANLVDTTISTSVNHDTLLKAKSHDITVDFSYPYGWQDKAEWNFNVCSTQAELFVLRDHVYLISDLVTDFSGGEEVLYEQFRPFDYRFRWDIRGYSAYLNVNDANIINNPIDFGENCYLSVHGDDAEITFSLPITSIIQKYVTVDFNIFTPHFSLFLNAPPWHTFSELLHYKEIGRSKNFNIKGSYTSYSEVDVDNVDALNIACETDYIVVLCYGVILKCMLNVKVNYFGEMVHFRTTEEYVEELQRRNKQNPSTCRPFNSDGNVHDSDVVATESNEIIDASFDAFGGPPTIKKSALKRSINELDVWFTFISKGGCFFFPENIYKFDACLGFYFDNLEASLRFLNYYVDAAVSLDSIYFKRHTDIDARTLFKVIEDIGIPIDASDAYLSQFSFRLHKMLGIMPSEESYACEFDVRVDTLDVHCDLAVLKAFVNTLRNLAFGFKDVENSLQYEREQVFDLNKISCVIENVTVKLQNVDKDEDIWLSLNLPVTTLTSFDLANERYSRRSDLSIPELLFGIYRGDSESTCLGAFSTGVTVTLFERFEQFARCRVLQRKHILVNDAPFHRCSFMLPPEYKKMPIYRSLYGCIPPSSSLPLFPEPISADNFEVIFEKLLGEIYQEYASDSSYQITDDSISSTEHDYHNQTVNAAIGTSSSLFIRSQNHQQTLSSFIVEFDPIDGYLDLSATEFMLEIYKYLTEVSLDEAIDSLEIGIINQFIQTFGEDNGISEVRVLCPNISLSATNKQSKFSMFKLSSKIKNLDITSRIKSSDPNLKPDPEKTTLCYKIDYIRANIVQDGIVVPPKQPSQLFSCSIELLEGYLSYDKLSLLDNNVQSCSVTLSPGTDKLLFEFLNPFISTFDLLQRELSSFEDTLLASKREFLLNILRGGRDYEIQHDPPVITKPANITRFSNRHIRSAESWRIIMRLRHILNYLPQEWHQSFTRHLGTQDFTSPEEAGKEFLSIFSDWRSWEPTDVQGSFVHEKVFTKKRSRPFAALQGFTFSSDDIRLNMKDDARVPITVKGVTLGIRNNGLAPEQVDGRTEGSMPDPDYISFCTTDEVVMRVDRSFVKTLKEFRDLIHRFKIGGPVGTAKHDNVSLFSNITFQFGKLYVVAKLAGVYLRICLDNLSALMLTSQSSVESKVISSSTLSFDHMQAILGYRSFRFMTIDIDMFSVLLHYLPGQGCYSIDWKARKFHIDSSSATTKDLTESLPYVRDEIKYLVEALVPELFAEPPIERESSGNKIHAVLFQGQVANITLKLQILSPFIILYCAENFELQAESTDSVIFDLNSGESYMEISSAKQKLDYFKYTHTCLKLSGTSSSARLFEHISCDIGILKLSVFDLKTRITDLLQDIKAALFSMKSLSDILNISQSSPTASAFGSWFSILPDNLSLQATYAGLLLGFGHTLYILEFNNFEAKHTRDGLPDAITPRPCFKVDHSIESASFLIKDRRIDDRLAKVVDFAVNFNMVHDTDLCIQSVQIESTHLKITLAPMTVVRLLSLINEFGIIRKQFTEESIYTPSSAHNNSTATECLEPSVWRLIIKSGHILSHDFSIVWLFDIPNSSADGLICGYDRLFSVYEKPYGKLTLLNAYFSAAKILASEADFYSSVVRKQRINTSYLSDMQLRYWFTEDSENTDLFIRIHGAKLAVDISAEIVTLLEETIQSIQTFNNLKKALVDPFRTKKQDSDISKEPYNWNNQLATGVRSLNCIINYAGVTLKLHSHDGRGDASPLELTSPSYKVAIDYKYFPNLEKTHRFRTLITATPTHNTFYSTSAFLIHDLCYRFSKLLKTSSTENKSSSASTSSSIKVEGSDNSTLLGSIDLVIILNVGKQEVTFSCEPKAKVQATVGFEKFDIKIFNNNINDEESLCLAIEIENLMTNSRHIYSREVCASLKLRHISMVFDIMGSQVRRIYGSTLISSPLFYFNMKQLQDLKLFIDQWFPQKTPMNTGSYPEGVLVDDISRSIGSKFYKGSSSSSFTWGYSVIVAGSCAEIELGPSLGVLNVTSEDVWAISKQQVDWSQQLDLNMGKLDVTSSGRLGGNFLVRNAHLSLELKWPNPKDFFQVPLVCVKLGSDTVDTKLSFDYHTFFISSLKQGYASLFNERDEDGSLADLLSVTVSFESVNIFLTALAAANISDIKNSITRLKKDNELSYLSSFLASDQPSDEPEEDGGIFDTLSLLRTQLSLNLGVFRLQISPTSLFDSDVLILTATKMMANTGIQADIKIKTDLHWQLDDVSLALLPFNNSLDESYLATMEVGKYIELSSTIQGGAIFSAPSIVVNMTTWQEPQSNVIELLYSTSFGGTVKIRWNLGPISFIKDMWQAHMNAMQLREGYYHGLAESGVAVTPLNSKAVPLEMHLGSDYQYLPLQEPDIEMPRIKDLGDATPPIEWFGVNRTKFPGFTHQFVIVPLQKLARTAEKEYEKILGRAL
ncbi:AGR088Wp [Eremothecium gossypii ATCC 10895]|uniref:Protein CSF1 n=1 Tax=Eremothecium gossypii (strain ATCC 10895 / CBS 109.51 / FGSC 9923 / NRRL Y-1056) TaxID=284811 RepID=CSF1_EREGS|nr:AGR088Wp [Eremothecium gossypii ATCC 10895]Q74ZX0.1 RecName: Full=Protein CSF1 [Eremothecium gossypii ATCC 10895]AAS54577.1 AGR088Wp [Eremothecium gossypii ATCC 10895]